MALLVVAWLCQIDKQFEYHTHAQTHTLTESLNRQISNSRLKLGSYTNRETEQKVRRERHLSCSMPNDISDKVAPTDDCFRRAHGQR